MIRKLRKELLRKCLGVGLFCVGVVGVTTIFTCAKQSGQDSTQAGDTIQITQLKSADQASQNFSGALNSIITTRIITTRPSAAPVYLLPDEYLAPELAPYIRPALLNVEKLLRLRPNQEQGNFELPKCEDMKPECPDGGKINKFNCSSGQSGQKSWIEGEAEVSQCKDKNIVSSGRAKFRIEAESGGILSHLMVYFENFSIEIYDDKGSKKFTLEFKPSFQEDMIFKVEASGTDLEAKFSSEIILKGNSSTFSVDANIKQNTIFGDLKLSLSYTLGATDVISELTMEVSGKYSVATSPYWCGDGGFEITTVKPLKVKIKDETVDPCPNSGEIKLNNSAGIKFEGENITIDVSGQSKKYKCEEFLKICPYPLPSIYEFLP